MPSTIRDHLVTCQAWTSPKAGFVPEKLAHEDSQPVDNEREARLTASVDHGVSIDAFVSLEKPTAAKRGGFSRNFR
jgi:hypothetical protein